MDKTLFMFPGQGSQSVGMGRDLYEKYSVVKKVLDDFNSSLDFDLLKVMFEGPEDVLNDTRYTQPALYSLSYAIFELLKDRDIAPDFLAGHSLGEYTAVAASGALDPVDGLLLVNERGKLMAEASSKAPGSMAAIVFKNPDEEFKVVEDVVSFLSKKGVIVVANHNGSSQVVISGQRELIAEAVELLKGKVRRVVPLAVSGAFHSPLMEPIARQFAEVLEKTSFKDAVVPLIMDVDAEIVRSASDIKERLLKQLTSSVLWTDVLRRAYREGVKSFVEVGPGRVLQGMVAKTLSGVDIKSYQALL